MNAIKLGQIIRMLRLNNLVLEGSWADKKGVFYGNFLGIVYSGQVESTARFQPVRKHFAGVI